MNAILRMYPKSGQSLIVLCKPDSPSASHVRLAPRPHATQVVPATGDAAVERTRRTQVWFETRHVSVISQRIFVVVKFESFDQQVCYRAIGAL